MKRICKCFLGVLFLIAATLAISSCGGIKQLKTPENLRIENEILSWDPVENAKEYLVEANDMTFQIKESSFDLFETILEPDDYKIRVTAIGDLKKYSDSEHSEDIEYVIRSAEEIIAFADGNHGECSIIGRGAKDFVGKLVIPSMIEEGQVTRIAKNAFRDCKNLTAVYIPDSVLSIGQSAFSHCTNLTRVRLSENIRKLESSQFSRTGIIEIKLPANLTEITGITGSTFENCFALERIEVAEENPVYRSEGNCVIRKEDNTVVVGCKTSVIPQGVERIIGSAFSYCEGLTKIAIPASVTKFMGTPFCGANNLECIEVAAGNPVYRSEGNCVIRKEDNVLVAGCKTSVIPEGVKEIDMSAFSEISSLTSIEIPGSVTKIDDYAFNKCTGLTKLTIGDGVTTIGARAFFGCNKLIAVTIPGSVRSIEHEAFKKCFASFIVPSSVQTIGIEAFYKSTVYTDAEESSVEWVDIDSSYIQGCEFGYDGAYPYVISWKYKLLPSVIPDLFQKMEIDAGGTIVPARAGYQFAGWATEKDGEVVYAPYNIEKKFSVRGSGIGDPTTVYRKQTTVAIYGDDEFNSLALDTVLYAVWRPLE